MIKINLMPKPEKKKTIKRLEAQMSACNKWISFYDYQIIEAQKGEIKCLEALLRLHGVNV